MNTISNLVALAILLGLVGCGGSTETVTKTPTQDVAEVQNEVRDVEVQDGMAVSGLLGSLEAHRVDAALKRKFDRFGQCFGNRYRKVPYLAGRFEMAFRAKTDGSVRWVYPKSSTVGDKETEDCLLDVAAATRFPEPTGGEAEFSWALELDAPEKVRTATPVTETQIAEFAGEVSLSVPDCGTGDVHVTVYIDKDGSIRAAGASVASADDMTRRQCVLEGVMAWQLGSPGSYAAKGNLVVK